jgi:hypothetical protein
MASSTTVIMLTSLLVFMFKKGEPRVTGSQESQAVMMLLPTIMLHKTV